jgi:hypothetical protein
VELITDMSLEEHPIFFHVFSNGGAFLYQHVSLAIQMHEKPLKVLSLNVITLLYNVVRSFQLNAKSVFPFE